MSLKQLRLLESSRAIMFTQKRIVTHFPANICLFKANNRNTRKRCEICSKSTIETLKKGVKYVQS